MSGMKRAVAVGAVLAAMAGVASCASGRGGAQRDFDRRGSCARPDLDRRDVGPPLSGESHLRPARRTVVHVERPRPQPDGRGLVHTARRAASPDCEGAGGGRVGLGREQPLRRVNHRRGHRRDHGPRRLQRKSLHESAGQALRPHGRGTHHWLNRAGPRRTALYRCRRSK
jgi:hypothetical protein